MSNFGILGATCFGSFECESCGIKKGIHISENIMANLKDANITRDTRIISSLLGKKPLIDFYIYLYPEELCLTLLEKQ